MLISQFAKATGLSIDTVRLYVAKGLLRPERSAKGGSNPYQLFGPEEVTVAQMIRLQQSLGYSLREIAALNEEYRSGAGSPERTAQILREQIGRLEQRRASINAALAFLTGKLAFVEGSGQGKAPELADYIC